MTRLLPFITVCLSLVGFAVFGSRFAEPGATHELQARLAESQLLSAKVSD